MSGHYQTSRISGCIPVTDSHDMTWQIQFGKCKFSKKSGDILQGKMYKTEGYTLITTMTSKSEI